MDEPTPKGAMVYPFTYSPRPAEDYIIKSQPICEARVAIRSPFPVPIWNLFWLSVPALDKLPGSGLNWWVSYDIVPGGLTAAIRDVVNFPLLRLMLMKSPLDFGAWWKSSTVTHLNGYPVFGDTWKKTVADRARSAIPLSLGIVEQQAVK